MILQSSWTEVMARKSQTFGAWLAGVESGRARGTLTLEITFPEYVREEERQAFAVLVGTQVRECKKWRELEELNWRVCVDAKWIFPTEQSSVLGEGRGQKG